MQAQVAELAASTAQQSRSIADQDVAVTKLQEVNQTQAQALLRTEKDLAVSQLDGDELRTQASIAAIRPAPAGVCMSV